jgi:hypothetical protein
MGGAAGTDAGQSPDLNGSRTGTAGTSGTPPPTPPCTSTNEASEAMSPPIFCAIFLSVCGTSYAGYQTMAECQTTYETIAVTNHNRERCQSYHLCLTALQGGPAQIHCPHAAGATVCSPDR